MTYEQALDFIHSRPRLGRKKPGIQRMAKLLQALGNPQKQLRFVHIAGTNGKGSVTSMTANILKQAGYKTGHFISPYILEFRERIQINGKMIPKEDLIRYAEQVKQIVDQMDAQDEIINEFEIDTAIGFLWFCAQQCDIVCLEVGLGGLYDATNVIDQSLVTVITSISLDHTNLLGNTTKEIAAEKCGVIKPNGTVITYPTQDIDALAVIMEQCALKNNMLVIPSLSAVQVVCNDLFHTEIQYNQLKLFIKLPGAHQIQNTLMVIEVIEALRKKGFSISDDAVCKGIATVEFPARQEVMHESPLVLVDGAHNLSGAQSLADTLDRLDGKKILIIGMLSDKDYEHATTLLSKRCDIVLTVTPDNPRALCAEDLKRVILPVCNRVEAFSNDYTAAFTRAMELAAVSDNIIISGSLYLASELRNVILKYFSKTK